MSNPQDWGLTGPSLGSRDRAPEGLKECEKGLGKDTKVLTSTVSLTFFFFFFSSISNLVCHFVSIWDWAHFWGTDGAMGALWVFD